MPYPFVLPTTSAFSFSSSFTCESHPSLPLTASTHRGVVRDVLKKHKRLPPSSQTPNLTSVVANLNSYIPYLLAVDAGLSHRSLYRDELISLIFKAAPLIEWRPTLTESPVPGKEVLRVKIRALEHEVLFALGTLANAHTLQARAALHPLHVTSTAPVGTQERQVAINTATRHLLDAAAVFDYLGSRSHSEQPGHPSPPCADIAPATLRAQAALAKAEATLLAVLKDDPYPAVVAQDRNRNDTEWMYKAPDIPKVRAHLFARLCLAAAEHAAQAHSLCGGHSGGSGSGGKLADRFVQYLEDLRRTSRAKACRFFGIDAELGGETGTALAWLRAAMQELGVEVKGDGAATAKKGGLSLSKLRKDWSEKREDKKIERGANWGADAGRMEETRVVEMLEMKWTKQNDTILTQAIPPHGPLLAQMPSGREIHTFKPYQPPLLDSNVLEAMRALPDRSDEVGDELSSDEETAVESAPAGAFPGTGGDYKTGTPSYF